jgi:hypothetical protein
MSSAARLMKYMGTLCYEWESRSQKSEQTPAIKKERMTENAQADSFQTMMYSQESQDFMIGNKAVK